MTIHSKRQQMRLQPIVVVFRVVFSIHAAHSLSALCLAMIDTMTTGACLSADWTSCSARLLRITAILTFPSCGVSGFSVLRRCYFGRLAATNFLDPSFQIQFIDLLCVVSNVLRISMAFSGDSLLSRWSNSCCLPRVEKTILAIIVMSSS